MKTTAEHTEPVKTQKSNMPLFSKANGNDSPFFFQPKLTVNEPNDIYEQEADSMADKVMRMPNKLVNHTFFKTAKNSILRNCTSCKEEEKKLHRKESGSSEISVAPPIVHDVLNSSNGKRLDAATRSFFEPRFGYDFSNVKIHDDSIAVKSAQSINALAYTSGNNIVFNENQYSPNSESGIKLLAHELTHVVQQKSWFAKKTINRAAIHTGRILDEGSCKHLACDSKWGCKDENGYLCSNGTKKNPLFTCDNDCSHARICDDNSNWMAKPKSKFRKNNCEQELIICANGTFTHSKVIDRSDKEAWEVSHGVQDDLGVSPYSTFTGVIYGDENDKEFKKDKRCGN